MKNTATMVEVQVDGTRVRVPVGSSVAAARPGMSSSTRSSPCSPARIEKPAIQRPPPAAGLRSAGRSCPW